MAIVMRRGPYSKFDPSKLLPGEWALVTSGHPDTSDGRALYHCFAAGVVRRMLTYEEAADEMRDILDVAFEGLKDDFTASVVAATSAANSAASSASSAATSANSAAANANAEAAKVLTYVQQELAAHPEWTTTVVDGSITQKKLHPSLHGLLNAPRRTLSGEVVSASDAYPCPPRGLVVEGESVQDGTPTPDAPVPIQSVTPNYIGFSDKVTSSSNGVTWSTGEGGRLKAVGTATGNTYAVGTPTDADLGKSYIPLLPAGTYTATSYWQVEFNVYSMPVGSASGTSLRSYSKDDFTFTLTEPRYVQLGVRATEGMVTDTEYELSIYEGSVRHPYTPKGSVGLLATGGNLLDIGSAMYSANRCAYEVTDTGITLTGNATTAYCYVNMRLVGLRGTCTLHFDVSSDLGHAVQVSSDVGVLIQRSEVTTATFTVPEDASYVTIYLYVKSDSSGTHTATFTNVQLEVGSTATPYQPYVETAIPIDLQGHALRSLPDGTHDELRVDADGNVTLVQRVGVLEMLASDWGTSSAGRYRHYVDEADIGLGTGHYTDMYCTAYQPTANTSSAAPANTIRFAADGLSLWLAAGSTLVDCELTYILAEPRVIDLGAVQLADMPGPDLTAYMVAGLTPDMELTYERDATLVIAALEAQIAEIATS